MSDIEYKNKYLKYKVKYINLKNELEQHNGGTKEKKSLLNRVSSSLFSAVSSTVSSTGSLTKKAVETAAKTSFWAGHNIIFFYLNTDKEIDFLEKDYQEKLKTTNPLDSKNGLIINFNDIKTQFGEKLWYWSNNDSAIKRNVSSIPKDICNCTIEKALNPEKIKLTGYDNSIDLKSKDAVINIIKAGIDALKKNEIDKIEKINANLTNKLKPSDSNTGEWYGAWVYGSNSFTDSKVFYILKEGAEYNYTYEHKVSANKVIEAFREYRAPKLTSAPTPAPTPTPAPAPASASASSSAPTLTPTPALLKKEQQESQEDKRKAKAERKAKAKAERKAAEIKAAERKAEEERKEADIEPMKEIATNITNNIFSEAFKNTLKPENAIPKAKSEAELKAEDETKLKAEDETKLKAEDEAKFNKIKENKIQGLATYAVSKLFEISKISKKNKLANENKK
jgi:hypothetical protein